jgi:hypothetical protein
MMGFAGALRVMGWGFAILGAATVAFFLFLALEPGESMVINNIATNDRHAKLVATAEIAAISLIGPLALFGIRKILLALLPNQSTDPTFASGTSRARHEPRHR